MTKTLTTTVKCLLDKVQRSAGDPMHLGPERTAAFIRQVLAERSYVVCHDTLTYGGQYSPTTGRRSAEGSSTPTAPGPPYC